MTESIGLSNRNILITTGIFPPQVGGPATYVPKLANYLHDKGANVRVLTTGKNLSTPDVPYRVERISSGLPGRLLESQNYLLRWRKWYDCAYVNGFAPDVYLSRFVCETNVVQKIVGDRSWEVSRNNSDVTCSIDEFQTVSVPLKTQIRREIHRRITRSADSIIVPSKYLKDIVSGWGIPKESINVIYNAVHPPGDFPTVEPEFPDKPNKLLTVGRMVPWKRMPMLIKVLSKVENAGLVVLGDGPEMEACRNTIKELNLQNQVYLKGNVDKSVVFQHFHHSDCFVLNSTYEGFPHVLLEAMYMETPVITSDSGGSKELAEFFPKYIQCFPAEKPRRLITLLNNEEFPSPDKPPDFDTKLQWDTICKQTAKLLSPNAPNRPFGES